MTPDCMMGIMYTVLFFNNCGDIVFQKNNKIIYNCDEQIHKNQLNHIIHKLRSMQVNKNMLTNDLRMKWKKYYI